MAGVRRGRMLTMPLWYLLAAVVGSLLVLVVAGVAYTSHAISQQEANEREQDRRWCELLVTLDDAYRSTPPASETGRAVARTIHDLRAALGCGP